MFFIYFTYCIFDLFECIFVKEIIINYTTMKTLDYYKKSVIVDSTNGLEITTLEDFFKKNGRDECTSPRGVMPRYFMEEKDGEYFIEYWGIPTKSNHVTIDVYNNEEEAELRLMEIYEAECSNDNSFCYQIFESIEKAEKELLNNYGELPENFEDIKKEWLNK